MPKVTSRILRKQAYLDYFNEDKIRREIAYEVLIEMFNELKEMVEPSSKEKVSELLLQLAKEVKNL